MNYFFKMRFVLFSLMISTVFTNSVHAAEQIRFSDDFTSTKSVYNENTFRILSLEECFNRAAINNKEIELAVSNLPIAQSEITISKAIPNPTYNMSYGFGPAWSYVIAGNNQQFGWNEEIQVTGKRTKKTEVARANYIQTFLQIAAVRFNIHNRVRRAYTELAIANSYNELLKSQLETAKKLLSISQERYDTGKVSGSEVLQAKLRLIQLEVQINTAQSRIVKDSAQLAFLLGETPKREEIIRVNEVDLYKILAGKSGLIPDPDQPIPTLDKLLPVAWKQRNDLKAAIQQAYVDRKALTLAKSKRIPDPFIGFGYLFSTYKPYQLQYFTPQPNAHTVPYQPGYLISVAEEVPLFYQYQGEINQAKATWLQQLKQNEQLRAQIAVAIISAYDALVMNAQNLRKCRQELLPAAAKAGQLSHRSYELGKIDLPTVILSQQQYGQLASSYFDTSIAYHNAWTDLEEAMGVSLNL
jgi:cobalt-zinc-cadmium efflux system outer membrane protein